MTPERWKRIEELYHTASALPTGERAAFLAEACREDEALLSDIESLLNEPASGDGFLEGRAFSGAARLMSDLAAAAMSGRSLAGYHLQSLLGAGGMGEVYRARDSTLGRDVAIKILPPVFIRDPDRLARFEREARILASLNHPNICAIYGLEEADDHRFLILELVDGETLAERLAGAADPRTGSPGLPVDEALSIARQIADALDAAHERGIIHRDLKPANVKITSDGLVKVLDFGLAKATKAEGSGDDLTSASVVTRGGSHDGPMLGTAAYMSPEQARGKVVDRRTDIWAFGCVLYEMFSGRAAFAADTVADTIARILEHEPDLSALPATTPPSIRRLLRRCLVKDPRARLRDIGDARIEIDAIDEAPPPEPERALSTPAAARPDSRWLPWIAVAALAAAVVAWETGRVRIDDHPLANARFTRLTDWEGTEGGADISPDGRFVAFAADRDGEFDVWWSQVGTDRFTNLTANIPPLGEPSVSFRTLGFSGDGAEIWFNLSGEPVLSRKLLVPLTGGPSRAFLGEGDATPSWSSDGARLVYFNNNRSRGDILLLADRTGGDARPIEIEPVDPADWSGGGDRDHSHNPVWSPDDGWLYFVHGVLHQLNWTDEMDVWRVRPSGGSPERLTRQKTAVTFLAPLDRRTLLYVARAEDGAGPWLWALDVASRVTRRVSAGLDQYTSVAASRDGRRLVATIANPTARLWTVPIAAGVSEERDVWPYRVPNARALAPRFGGKSLFFLSARGTADGLWRVQDGQAVEVRKGVDGALFEPPAVSRDGSRVALTLARETRRRLVVMAADGTGLRGPADSIDVHGTADWSPDGAWIVTGGNDDALGPGLFKIPAGGGAPVRLAAGPAANPVWSPDGRLIVYNGAVVTGQAPLLGVRPDGAAVELPAVRVRQGGFRFLPDGTGLVYLLRAQSADFWLLHLTSGTTQQLLRLGARGGVVGAFDITPDGEHIVFDRLRENSDIVLIDLPK